MGAQQRKRFGWGVWISNLRTADGREIMVALDDDDHEIAREELGPDADIVDTHRRLLRILQRKAPRRRLELVRDPEPDLEKARRQEIIDAMSPAAYALYRRQVVKFGPRAPLPGRRPR